MLCIYARCHHDDLVGGRCSRVLGKWTVLLLVQPFLSLRPQVPCMQRPCLPTNYTLLRNTRPHRYAYSSKARENPSKSGRAPHQLSASAKLFADAAREESEDNPPSRAKVTVLETKYENWTGDESIQDAVLRMLMDKYKPLRTGSVQSAEERLRRNPPSIYSAHEGGTKPDVSEFGHTVSLSRPTTGSWASESLLPSRAGHEPWHTTFKAPSNEASVKLAQMPPPMVSSNPTSYTLDDRGRRLEKDQRKKAQLAGRLSDAKESTLDYRLGVKSANAQGPIASRPNPVSVKGWASLVEDRIEVCLIRLHVLTISLMHYSSGLVKLDCSRTLKVEDNHSFDQQKNTTLSLLAKSSS